MSDKKVGMVYKTGHTRKKEIHRCQLCGCVIDGSGYYCEKCTSYYKHWIMRDTTIGDNK